MQNNFIYQILKKIVDKNPKSIAIEIEKKKITYEKFFDDCLKFSNYVNRFNLNTIGIIGDYSYLSYVSIFGTLISGKTYVPINQNLPYQKIKRIITISKIDALSHSSYINNIFKKINLKKITLRKLNEINSYSKIRNKYSKLAYIIFTSGSTGEPKGVPIKRASLNHYINWLKRNFNLNKNCRCSQFPNIGFDLSVVDIFSTICSGGTLIIPNNIYNRNFPAKFIKENKITHAVFVPSYVQLMVNSQQLNYNHLKSLKKIFFCGEPLYENQISKLFKSNKYLKIINAYGPTEATVSCTKLLLNKDNFKKYCNDTVSIGKPISGMKFKLIKRLNLHEKFYEILISGPQVFEGYIKNTKLNKSKFITINKSKYFITGDLIEKKNNNFYFRKRIDTQVKIRGYRVELDEIDLQIRNFGILQSKTIYKDLKLSTFIISKTNKVNNLYKYLKSVLPEYMVPNSIIVLKSFPRNLNDKIDEKQLNRYL